MKVIKTENEGKAWSLYGKGGLAFTAETQEELVAKILSDYEQMRQALSEICTLADVERQWPYDTRRMVNCFVEIKDIAGRSLSRNHPIRGPVATHCSLASGPPKKLSKIVDCGIATIKADGIL